MVALFATRCKVSVGEAGAATKQGTRVADLLECYPRKAYLNQMWRRSDVRFVLDSNLSEGEVATMRVETPVGDLLVMGQPAQDVSGSVLRVSGVHTNAPFGSLLASQCDRPGESSGDRASVPGGVWI